MEIKVSKIDLRIIFSKYRCNVFRAVFTLKGLLRAFSGFTFTSLVEGQIDVFS